MISPSIVLGRLLLRVALGNADREFLQGDLEEELARRQGDPVRRNGAGRWFLSQAVRAASGRRLARTLHYWAIAGRWNRDRKGDGFMTSLTQDVVFSLRTLRKQPGFTVTVLITLALGIGATATMLN